MQNASVSVVQFKICLVIDHFTLVYCCPEGRRQYCMWTLQIWWRKKSVGRPAENTWLASMLVHIRKQTAVGLRQRQMVIVHSSKTGDIKHNISSAYCGV